MPRRRPSLSVPEREIYVRIKEQEIAGHENASQLAGKEGQWERKAQAPWSGRKQDSRKPSP